MICIILALMILFVSADGFAIVKMRRPFANNVAFNYGFDNKAGGACEDYNCGSRCYNDHHGTDFPVPTGTDILAPAAGTVSSTYNGCASTGFLGSECGGGCGNYVTIQHSDGTRTQFCHFQINSIVVSPGQAVTCGQKVGRSASSGNSSGPHVHHAWYADGGRRDLFKGACTTSPGAWNQQNGYRDAVGDSCLCVPAAEACDGQDNDCNGQVDDGDVCQIEWLNDRVESYAPSQSTDVNGDGKADVCGRGGVGLWCHLANENGFEVDPGVVLPLSDAAGWTNPIYASTIRMGDIDGDGKADLCARAADRVYCWKLGAEEWEQIDGPALSDDSGWDKPEHYSTIRLADINGDGMHDLCARAGTGMRCWLSEGNGFSSEAIVGPEWSNDAGFNQAKYYGTLRTGDINGDGLDDLCIRAADGIQCALSHGAGFDPIFHGPDWLDSNGWGVLTYWSSIRMADVNGDGMSDICARAGAGLRCHLSQGTGFGEPIVVAELSDELGWNDVSNNSTLRTGDINGDGAQDLCIRSNSQVLCYVWNGASFDRVDGPEWTDANGWNAAQHFDTLRMGDFNGDGRADVCGRAASGWLCAAADGTDFFTVPVLPEFTNAGGWSAKKYYSTLRFGGPSCRLVESCNGRDDDCNGVVDDHPIDAGGPCVLEQSEHCMVGELSCSAGGLICSPVPDANNPECVDVNVNPGAPDSQTPESTTDGQNSGTSTYATGNACSSTQAGNSWLFLLLAIFGFGRRRLQH